MIKLAIGSVPKDGGTFTFYRTVRPFLRRQGIETFCVSVGHKEATLWQQEFADDGCVRLASHARSLKSQAQAFAQWCHETGIDIVIGINSAAILSSLPHLPEHIRVVARCANTFDHGYRITLACRERLARIVVLTPRMQRDLVDRYGADANGIRLIPNGIDPRPFNRGANTARGSGRAIRLGFLGRLEHRQKGVLFLPEIVSYLERQRVPYELRIAGKGIHQGKLKKVLASVVKQGRIEFAGQLSPSDVPEFLAATDIFLFPSQFEGCPNALLEAMMAGCVPVCWRLEGITDFVVEHGATGLLAPKGGCGEFGELICQFANDRDLLRRIAQNATAEARVRFTQERVGRDYANLFQEVMDKPPPKWAPKPWSDFRPEPEFKPRWTTLIPESCKRPIRQLMANVGLR